MSTLRLRATTAAAPRVTTRFTERYWCGHPFAGAGWRGCASSRTSPQKCAPPAGSAR